MTDVANTIEEQMGTLARQYTFLENVCHGLTEEVNRLNSEAEHKDIVIADMRRQITELTERQCQCTYVDISCQVLAQ